MKELSLVKLKIVMKSLFTRYMQRLGLHYIHSVPATRARCPSWNPSEVLRGIKDFNVKSWHLADPLTLDREGWPKLETNTVVPSSIVFALQDGSGHIERTGPEYPGMLTSA